MVHYIVLVAITIFICLLLNKISSKLGIPMLLGFILLGMLFGSDGILKIHFDNYQFAEQICSICLIFIIFYGGFGTHWRQAKPVAPIAILLSTLGVVLTALITAIFSFYILHFDFWESLLIGAVVSSTDAASVFSILRSKQLSLKYNTASMLELESGSNDPCSYMLTIIVLSLMGQKTSDISLLSLMFTQIVYGVLIGVLIAFLSVFILQKFKFPTEGFDTIFVFGVALSAYAFSALVGGNGYLSTYITGIILGNKGIPNQKSLIHFFDGLTGLMQMLIFFLLGLLSFPSELPPVLLVSLAIALFLTFVARPLAVMAILTPFKCPMNQQLLVSWAGLRGASSIVFAIMATISPAYMKDDLFHMVFFIVLFSVSIQGTLLSFVSKKLDMISDDHNIMKTFSDYSDETPVEFIKLPMSDSHPWINKKIKDIHLIPDLLIVLILRGKEKIIPKGNTLITTGDTVVVSALSVEETLGACLTELIVKKDSPYLGLPLSAAKLGKEKLVLIIKRHHKTVIPTGKTILKENDILVIMRVD